jgi:hypothetical protein
MSHSNKNKKESGNTTHADVRKEMEKLPMARSARIEILDMDTSRNPKQPSATMPGTVNRITPSPRPNRPEKAEIAVHTADPRYRDLRIENVLTNEHGDDVKLKKGAQVDVTVTADSRTLNRST